MCRLPFISAATSPLPAARGGLQRRVLGTVRGHDPALGDVEVRLIRDLADLGLGAEQHGQDQPGLGGLHRASQRIGAARVHHAGQHRLETSTAFDEPFEPMLRHLVLLPRRRRQNFQHRGGENLTRRIGALAVQHDDPLIRPLLPHDEPRRHRRADRQRTFDLHRGCADRGSGSREGRTNKRGQDSRDDAGSPLALAGTGKHVHFAEGGSPGPHVAGLQRALDRRGVADGDLFERLVHDGLHGCGYNPTGAACMRAASAQRDTAERRAAVSATEARPDGTRAAGFSIGAASTCDSWAKRSRSAAIGGSPAPTIALHLLQQFLARIRLRYQGCKRFHRALPLELQQEGLVSHQRLELGER